METLGNVLFCLAVFISIFAIVLNLYGDVVKKFVYSRCPRQIVRGYKGFEYDLTCSGYQYRIGEVFAYPHFPVAGLQGFHFCKNLKDVFRYYPPYPSAKNVYCEIEAIGRVSQSSFDPEKFCTDCIRIVRILTPDEVVEQVKQEGGSDFDTSLNRYKEWFNNEYTEGLLE